MHDHRPSAPPADSRLASQKEWPVLAALAAIALLRAVVAATMPLSVDEAYYWQWTRPLQLSYYDHPAMVAYWIWGGLRLLGENPLGLRLFAVLGACAVTALVWDTTRLAFGSRRAANQAALWLNCTILFDSAGVLITPDAPLLLFWSLSLWALVRLIIEGKARYLFVAGAALGLGAVSKYTMALLVPGILCTFLLFPALRAWWRRPGPYLAALLGLLCMTPLLLWNLANHGASFTKQLNHAFAGTVGDALASLLGWLTSQAGLLTPLIFAFSLWGMGWALVTGWRRRRPEWFLLGATSLPVVAFFLSHSLQGAVQAHWAGPAYLGGVMAAAGAWLDHDGKRRWAWAFTAAPWVGLVMVLTVFLQASTAILPIPLKIDALKRLGGWPELARLVQEERLAHPGAFLMTQKHEPTGITSFYLPDHAPVFLQGRIRPSYYTAAEVAALKGHDAIFISRAREDGAAGIRDKFARVTFLRQIVLSWGGRPADAYNLYLAEDYRGGALVMGDGLNGALDLP